MSSARDLLSLSRIAETIDLVRSWRASPSDHQRLESRLDSGEDRAFVPTAAVSEEAQTRATAELLQHVK